MSDVLSVAKAKALYSAMRARERGGCSSLCLHDDLKFTPGNGGGDVRFPTGVLARFIEKEFGIPEEVITDEYDDVFMEEINEDGPMLSPTHPIKIVWNVNGPEVPTSRAWVVPCSEKTDCASSTTSTISLNDPLVEELR